MIEPGVGPLFIFGLLDRVVENAEVSFALAALLVAFYVRRGAGLASSAAAVAGTTVTYTVVLLVLLSFGTIFGWVNPDPSVAYAHVTRAAAFIHETVIVRLIDRLSVLFPRVSAP